MNAKLLLNKALFKLSEKSPVILLTIGVVGVVAGTVMAVKATKNSKDIDDELKEDLETLELKKQEELENLEANNIKLEKFEEDGKEYSRTTELVSIKDNLSKEDMELVTFTKEDYNKLRNKIVLNATKKYLLLYSKSIVVETASIICIIAGFRIIAKRYAALAIAYAGLDNSFREYRKRVQKEIGQDKENELYYGYKKELEKIKDENGKVKEVEKIKINDKAISQYAVFFDESSSEWSNEPGYNRTFLQTLQKSMQRRLESQGHVFLNEVKDKLGLPRTPEGQLVGWKLGMPNSDGYISFGLLNDYNKEAVNARNNVWLLDFNVDGNIYNEI